MTEKRTIKDPMADKTPLDITLESLRARQQAYQQVFSNTSAKLVLEDLARFCRANTTTFDPNDRVHAALEGKREVWLRIHSHLNLSVEELFNLLK